MSPVPSDAHDGLDRAAEALTATLGKALGHVDPKRIRSTRDGLLRLSGTQGRTVVAKALARPSATTVVGAWRALQEHAGADDEIPVVVVPQLSRSVARAAESEGINWVDLAGNAHVVAQSLLVHIEGKRAARARLGPSVDPFAPRSANIVRILLVDPQQVWQQKQLVTRSGVSQPRTSKVLGALEDLSLVRREDGGGVVVADPEALLDAWADAYRYLRNEIVPAHVTADGMQLARGLQDRLRQAHVSHWFTGLPAAWAYDEFARFRLVSVFVDADPELVRRDLDLRASPKGANVHLISSREQKLEIGQGDPQGLRCAHPSQVYLDLLGLPERASEAAEHLRQLAAGQSQT